ncbi:hypothetical protein LINPERPRIM_LOCUS30828, partial [Linum perenne]
MRKIDTFISHPNVSVWIDPIPYFAWTSQPRGSEPILQRNPFFRRDRSRIFNHFSFS